MMDSIWPIFTVSLKVATAATSIVMTCSVFLAFALVKRRTKLMKLIELAIYLPMALPPVALGYGLLLLLGRNSAIGTLLHNVFGIHISFTVMGAVIAAVAVSLGLGVRTVRLALERIEKDQETIARLLGATPIEIAWHIYLPQCWPAIFGGAVLVFIRAISEFGATMVLAGNTLGETRTLALAIWVGMETPGQERQCMLLVMVAFFISLIAVLSAELLLRKSARE